MLVRSVTAAITNGYRVGTRGRNIAIHEVVHWLNNRTAPAAQRTARNLLHLMSTGAWCVVDGVHQNANDKTRHITIEVPRGGNRYHLRLDGQNVVSDITFGQNQRPGGIPPWVGPGSQGTGKGGAI